MLLLNSRHLVKVQLSLCNYNAMTVSEGVHLKLRTFLILAIDGGVRSAQCHGCFIAWKGAPHCPLNRRVGCSADLV
jgi:hypothetical protein